jgi:trimethylamine---corrinoid protein Co-methyltransferase
VGARNDLVVNCGMFATGVTCSHEQLLMDEMISAASLRIAAGMNVTPDTVARDLIAKVGPMSMGITGGNYLTELHTLERLRGEEYLRPRLTVTGAYTAWRDRGSKDTYAMARDEVRRLRATPPPPFDASRRRAMEEIAAGFKA